MLGLGIYAALLYAAILLFNVTLTLPGFAGLVLTLGVAADANVVIFERIKEEVRAGSRCGRRSPTGYAKGFNTIVDANAVTAIAALILFAARRKRKGLRADAPDRYGDLDDHRGRRNPRDAGVLAGFRWFHNPKFMGATGDEIPRWQRIDVVGRRLWFIVSLVAVG